ncbi:MAG: alpha/beta fold hydrolase [Pseudomonadota bacterium]
MTPTYPFDLRHQVHRSTFVSNGVTCSATLRIPMHDHTSRTFPAVLMAHGWGSTQMSLLPPFYERFLELGFAVMTFDYRGWGQSEGEPRYVISVSDRLDDVRAALGHIRADPMIDPNGIVLWGSSLGGGHVCSIAARDNHLLGVIAQVPMLDGQAASVIMPLGQKLKFATWALYDLIGSKWFGRPPYYIPVTSKPGERGTMSRDGAHEARERGEQLYGRHTPNKIAARSILTLGTYRPVRDLHEIQAPTLIVWGRQDTVAPFNRHAVDACNNPRMRVVAIDADHFAPYFQPMVDRNLGIQSDFLRTRYDDWHRRSETITSGGLPNASHPI